MSAASEYEVNELDKSLAADGQWVDLQRLIGTQLIPITVKVRAFIVPIDTKTLVPGIIFETDETFVISPTQIIRAGWPGPNSSKTPTKHDRRVPGPPDYPADRLVINGRPRTIAASKPRYIDGELIRIDGRVTG